MKSEFFKTINMVIRQLNKYLVLMKSFMAKNRWRFFLSNLADFRHGRPNLKYGPAVLQLEPTSCCNLRCGLCVHGMEELWRRTPAHLSLSLFEKIIKQMEKTAAVLCLYLNGEPWLNPAIFKMIRYAKKNKLFVRLSTSADFSDKIQARRLIASGPAEIIVSLDCAAKETYENYKKSPRFEQVLDNIKYLIKLRGNRLAPFIYLQFLVMKQNEHELSGFKKLAEKLNVDGLLIKKIRVSNFGWPDRPEYLPDNKRLAEKKTDDKRCWRPWLTATVFFDGSVVPCCFDMNGGWILGGGSGMILLKTSGSTGNFHCFAGKSPATGMIYPCAGCATARIFLIILLTGTPLYKQNA